MLSDGQVYVCEFSSGTYSNGVIRNPLRVDCKAPFLENTANHHQYCILKFNTTDPSSSNRRGIIIK